ncbi:uncharacterized protein LOC129313885 [Prosopis cineraria]|uniref:uncharacterized protein LOC129313885 n=1 Tax=Prosopis cineraria TaxID=364024 RepID=UPI0024107880|nr:uncharacterized protein LOC129313885 [Prosopis cineraria]
MAAASGITQVAKSLVKKNSIILAIPQRDDDLPVTMAFHCGHHEMGRYLYSVTPLECHIGSPGSRLLRSCLHALCFGSLHIVLHLLQRREELLFVHFDSSRNWMPIYGIATLNSSIISPRELVFWKRWIYNCIKISSTTAINHVCTEIQQENRSQREEENLTESAKEGNVDFVFQISKAIPQILLNPIVTAGFQDAVKFRQARVFNLSHGLRFKSVLVMSGLDDEENTLLHMVATKAPDHVLNRIYAPTLQMQRELQWFKEVETIITPVFRGLRNKHGMTAEELFRESHKNLMKAGEKWIKATASSCSVVGALIVTIMFAAAFTVSGGNDQNFGYPLFIKQPFFKLFIFSTILSLLSSSTSVLMFLAILTSQYSEEKFLKSLPTKLILGLSFLFISILSMMIAFLSTIRLMLKHTNYSWGLLPIIILASVPVFLFVLSQFPLLLHAAVSTYGSIFSRKVKPWP